TAGVLPRPPHRTGAERHHVPGMNGAGSRSANAGVRGAVRPSSPPIIRDRPETAGRMYGRRPTRAAAGADYSRHPSPRAERSEPGSEQDPAADDELLPAAQLETQLRARRDTAPAELGTTHEVQPDLRVARRASAGFMDSHARTPDVQRSAVR